jgi:molybdopterin synthase catalytic subunit/molybdopterin synthase sulfur carrier subunit
MQVAVRLSGELATQVGRPRFSVTLADGATVGDLTDLLRREYPESPPLLNTAVPIIAGRHIMQSEPLADGQEVAYLLPIAGG